MSATKINLTYNPYTVETEIAVNGEVINDGLVEICKNKRLQQWIDKIFPKISESFNTRNIEFVFKGTVLDAEDVKDAVKKFNEKSEIVKITDKYNTTDKSPEHKVTDLRELFEEAQKGPFEEFRSDEMKTNFNIALSPEFEVNVIATMSSGKSTVINSMLGKELMPAKNEACTATVAKVEDHDEMKNFIARRLDKNKNILDEWQDCDNKLMENWNDDATTSQIEIKGDIPAVKEREGDRLVLIDTPGPNNSRDASHREATNKAISDKKLTMVLYILNATQLSTDDDMKLLEMIKDTMSKGGRKAQDRFIFIANKIDTFDPERGESVKKALDNVKNYLISNGIKNPIVIPTSAELAKLIRIVQFEGKSSLSRSQKGNLRTFVELFTEEEEMNMLEHVKEYISKSTYERLNEKLASERKNSNEHKQAEILSGIPIIETLLDDFISKHAIPTKLKDAVDSFQSAINKAISIEKINNIIQKDASEIEKFTKKIEKFQNDKTRIEEANNFREKVKNQKYELSNSSEKMIETIEEEVEELLDSLSESFSNHLEPQKAQRIFENATKGCAMLNIDIQTKLENDLKENFYSKLNQLKEEFEKYIANVLNKAFPDDNDFEIRELQENSMQIGSVNNLIKSATYKKRVVAYKETILTGKWYNPFSWFDSEEKNIYENVERVNMKAPWQKLQNSLRATKNKNINNYKKLATEQVETAKNTLLEKMISINKKLEENITNLNSINANKENKEEVIKENKLKIEWYNNFTQKLNKILSI